MEKDENIFIPFSEMHERAMRDPEFRKGYEALAIEEVTIRTSIDKRIKAKKLEEARLQTSPN